MGDSPPPSNEITSTSNVTLERIAFGSCNKQKFQQPLWPVIASFRPQLWLWMGDAAYIPPPGSVAQVREALATQRAVPAYTAFLDSLVAERSGSAGGGGIGTIVEGVFDDHDYGINDSGGDVPDREGRKNAFLDFLGVPTEPSRDRRRSIGAAGLYSAHDFGAAPRKVRVILLDTRSFRDPFCSGNVSGWRQRLPGAAALSVLGRFLTTALCLCPDYGGDMLGAAQWQWLEGVLGGSDAAVHLLVSTVQIHTTNPLLESWGHFPASKRRLLRLLDRYRPRGFVALSGDVHFAELHRPIPVAYPAAAAVTATDAAADAGADATAAARTACPAGASGREWDCPAPAAGGAAAAADGNAAGDGVAVVAGGVFIGPGIGPEPELGYYGEGGAGGVPAAALLEGAAAHAAAAAAARAAVEFEAHQRDGANDPAKRGAEEALQNPTGPGRVVEVTTSGMTHSCATSFGTGRCARVLRHYSAHRAGGRDAFYMGLNFGTLDIEWQEAPPPGFGSAAPAGGDGGGGGCALCLNNEEDHLAGAVAGTAVGAAAVAPTVCHATLRVSVRDEAGRRVLGYTTSSCDRYRADDTLLAGADVFEGCPQRGYKIALAGGAALAALAAAAVALVAWRRRGGGWQEHHRRPAAERKDS